MSASRQTSEFASLRGQCPTRQRVVATAYLNIFSLFGHHLAAVRYAVVRTWKEIWQLRYQCFSASGPEVRFERADVSGATAGSLQPVGRLAALAQRPRRPREATRSVAAWPFRRGRTVSVRQQSMKKGAVQGATGGSGQHVCSAPYK